MIPTPSSLLATAVLAARRAGTHALTQRNRRHEANLVARHDVKLQLDVECQAVATETVLASFPDHGVLGEEDTPETAATSAGSPYEWIIDPIDGTVNFFHGNPYWCCSVAVRRDGEMLAGCVYAPSMNLLFEGAIDQPARCNGEIIHVSDTPDLTMSNVHTGADKDAKPGSQPFRFFNCIAGLVQRPRICGAAALDICQVAAGGADAFFEPSIYIWDIAAADLILRRAGGSGTILRQFGRHRLAYLASNGRIHAPLAAALEPLFDA
jgi:myo-inositol-1(or 4)-monophosphatase